MYEHMHRVIAIRWYPDGTLMGYVCRYCVSKANCSSSGVCLLSQPDHHRPTGLHSEGMYDHAMPFISLINEGVVA